MSSRRLARAKKNPRFNLPTDEDPHRIHGRTIEHPIYGAVRLWIQAGRIDRLRWSASDQGQNFHKRHNNPQKFADILRKLGIDS